MKTQFQVIKEVKKTKNKNNSSLTETEQNENYLLLMVKHNKEDKAGDVDKF